MQNVSSTFTNFLLLGMVEMKGYEYLYGTVSLVIYLLILLLSLVIVLVVLTDHTLHEPMYILICNLTLNGIFGSSSFFPKLIIDLFSLSKIVSRGSCFMQALCITIFAMSEISIFNIMAYDRYLAVCHPLHYQMIMTNKMVLRVIIGTLVFMAFLSAISLILTSTLPLCGQHIRNIFCDNIAIAKLSCVDTSGNSLYGATIITIALVFTLLTIVYSYQRIFAVCATVSKEAFHKTIHTLVTHILNFSIFLVGVLFIVIRYRINAVNTSIALQVLLSATPMVGSPILSPIIYGIRTKALRVRVIQKIKWWTNLSSSS